MKILIPLLLTVMTFTSCSSHIKYVKKMPICDVDLTSIQDGVYRGSFAYGRGKGFTYEVQTYVTNHRIVKIEVSQHNGTKYPKKAERVLKRIIDSQTPNVDVVSGATTVSKALMKAVENSLIKNQ